MSNTKRKFTWTTVEEVIKFYLENERLPNSNKSDETRLYNFIYKQIIRKGKKLPLLIERFKELSVDILMEIQPRKPISRSQKKPEIKLDQCPICYENLTIDNVMNLTCKHKLCNTCYYNWTDNQGKNTCPCCRNQLYSKVISERLLEVRELQNVIDDLEYKENYYDNKINNLFAEIEDIQTDRDYLIHEKVEYDKKIKKQKQTLQGLEFDLDIIEDEIEDNKKYAKEINAIIPKEITHDHRKLAIHFRKIAEEHEKKYDNYIKKSQKTVIKSLNYINKRNHTINNILKKCIETNKRERIKNDDEDDISIGDSILFKNDVED